MLQGEEIEFALSPKDPKDLTKTFAIELVDQLTTNGIREICGHDLVLPAHKARATVAYFLTNGSKVYADEVSQPGGRKYRIFEIATPEVIHALDVVRYDKAAEKIARVMTQALKASRGTVIECYKTSIATGNPGDGYTTRGAHESYRVQKEFREKIHLLIPFLVLRQLFCGSGGYYHHRPVISPRQFFVEQTVSEVSVPVPMVCLRSESLSVGGNFIRLQVLNGDPTRSQVPTFLRFALTGLLIECIQQGFVVTVPELEDAVQTARLIAEGWESPLLIRLKNGRRINAVDYLQEIYLKPMERFADEIELDDKMRQAMQFFREILIDLGGNRLERLSRKVEWATKLDLFEWNYDAYFDQDEDIPYPRETANNAFCAVTDSLFDELENHLDIARLISDDEIHQAMIRPPALSRGQARTEIAQRFPGDVDDINWDYIVVRGEKFKLAEDVEWDTEAILNTVKEIRRRAFKA